MADINSLVLVGRLARDAELKYTSAGVAICTFTLAVKRRVKQGERWGDEANFFDAALFGKQGEAVAQYMKKGGQVGITGELRQERWEKDGQKHSKVAIIANNVQLLGGKKDDSRPNSSGSQSDNAQEQAAKKVFGDGEFVDDIF